MTRCVVSRWSLASFAILAFLLPSPWDVAAAGLSAEILYPRTGIQNVVISPTGRWIAAEATQGRRNGVLVQRVGTARSQALLATEDLLLSIYWIGPDTLAAAFWSGGRRRLMATRLDETRDRQEIIWIDAAGWLVDPLPLDDDELIWEFEQGVTDSVHRLTLSQLLEYGDRRTSSGRSVLPGDRLARLMGDVDRWLVDRNGRPRVAWRRDESGYTILARGPRRGNFTSIYRYDDEFTDERGLEPVALSPDESKIIVMGYAGYDTRGLHELDPETGKLGATLFRREDVDVVGIRVDDQTHDIIAAIYELEGERRSHYFDAYRRRFLAGLEGELPIDSIDATTGTQDRRYFVYRISDSTNPGEYFLRDNLTGATVRVGAVASEIDNDRLSETTSFVVKSRDGMEIESYLTLPRNRTGPAPLVVRPHGGPHGVRHRRRFDPLVQYLASWGFAVLQPNYRGSSGYGLEFQESIKREWARGIEDDIDAAVEYAMAMPEVDRERICIMGGSYGGFSALASVVRHRDRYRCAISINGVTDVPLLYDSSDMADSKRAMEFYEEYVGDLETDREALIEISPAYHVAEIDTPVFMIYGTEDRRVDPDHSHRMLVMLETHDKEHDSLEIEGMRHSPRRLEWIIISRAVRRNLTRYLRPDEEFVRDPPTGSDRASEVLPRPRFEN